MGGGGLMDVQREANGQTEGDQWSRSDAIYELFCKLFFAQTAETAGLLGMANYSLGYKLVCCK